MAVLKNLKLPNPLFSLSAVVGICFFFIFLLSTNPSRWIGKPLSSEAKELAIVLSEAAMADRTVILTTINEAWAAPNSMIDLFMESFRIGEETKRLLSHLIIVCMDRRAYDRCKSIHNHCYSLTTEGVDLSAEKRFMTEDYLKMMWRRIDFSRSVLELGYSFVFTDADVMWFRNPFSHFPLGTDIVIASDFYVGNPRDVNNRANGGFLHAKANVLTVEFYKYWYMAKSLHPGLHDQDVFNIIKNDHFTTRIGVDIRFLDTSFFGGFCQPSRDLNKVCTMHANCCVGIEKKLYDLRLVLEDWRNFTSLSSEEKRLRGSSSSSSPWRAPNKCKFW